MLLPRLLCLWAFHSVLRNACAVPLFVLQHVGGGYDVGSNAGRSNFDVRPVLKGASWNRSEQIGPKNS
jgi:hypothetical protein